MKFINLFFIIQVLSFAASAQIEVTPKRNNKAGLPIKSGRTISITTTEASYLDVDISPDGSTILFSCLGELFSLPAKGGIATQLTHGLAINRCPIWSPDGNLIAYESDCTGLIKLHVTNLANSFQKVLDIPSYGESLRTIWFPDSKKLAIYDKVYDLTGTVSSIPKEMRSVLDFSLDGRFVYFQKYSSDSLTIVKHNRLNQKNTKLFAFKLYNHRSCYNPLVSPDGNWLTYIKNKNLDPITNLYTNSDSLMAINLNTGEEKLLVHLDIKFTTGFLDKQHYSFSRDSKYLFIGYAGKIHRINIETVEDDIIPFTANVKIDMGPLVYNKFEVLLDSLDVKYIRCAQKSPDGKHLVFSALNKIFIQDMPNGRPRILINQPLNQFQPNYSPDGKWICYVSWNDQSGGCLWRVPSSGGKPEQLTTIGGLYQHPSWSPDGSSILVICSEKNSGEPINRDQGQLKIISVKDKRVKVIESKIPFFNYPEFSESGQQIFFSPDQQKSNSNIWPILVSKTLGCTEVTPVAHSLQNNFISPIRQTLLSPDGKYIAFVFNEDLYLAPRAGIGGTQCIFDITTPVPLIRFARGAMDPHWEENGEVLGWTDGNKYCRIKPNRIIEAAIYLKPNKILESLPQTKIIDVDILADETITIRLKIPRLYGNGIIVLKNVRIITMHGKQVIENATLVIKNGKFVNIGATDKVTIPKEAEVFDLKGKTIAPGLIDMHSHMPYTYPPDIFLQQSWEKLLAISYGVTTRRNPSGSIDEFGYNELIEAGQMLGPRSFTVGRAIRPDVYKLNSLHEAKVMVSAPVKYGATYIKQYTQPTRLQRQLLLQTCKEARVNMTNEVEKQPLYCLGMFKDGSTGVEHNPEWGEVSDDIIKLVAKSGTYLCPTLQVCYGKEEGKHYFHKLFGQDFINRSGGFMDDFYKENLLKEIQEDHLDTGFLQQSRIDARIKHAGGKIVMGSHGEDQGIGAHWEIWALQMGGLTNYEALETATITAAEALGMQKDLGSIEVGKIADLIILDKNPLEDIHNTTSIKYVMKAGVLYEADTLNEVWPEWKLCPEWRMKSDAKNETIKINAANN